MERGDTFIAPRGVAPGDELFSGRGAPIRAGNCLSLSEIPVGTMVHCVEFKPGKGAQIARSAGASVQLVAREGGFATLRLRSGELRKVPVVCRAVVGEVGNVEHSLRSLGKAGAGRWRGRRPHRTRCRNESRRPSSRRWGRAVVGRSPSRDALGSADKRTQDATQQENVGDDRATEKPAQVRGVAIVPRSIRKGPFVDNHLMRKVEVARAANSRRPIRTWSRRSMVIPEMIGLTIAIHNGRQHVPGSGDRKHGRTQARRICTDPHVPRSRCRSEGEEIARRERSSWRYQRRFGMHACLPRRRGS